MLSNNSSLSGVESHVEIGKQEQTLSWNYKARPDTVVAVRLKVNGLMVIPFSSRMAELGSGGQTGFVGIMVHLKITQV